MTEQDNPESSASCVYLRINCDQVAWLLATFDRYLPHDNYPAISRQREMLKLGMLYEVMEIANLIFADEAAETNATPKSLICARGIAEAMDK